MLIQAYRGNTKRVTKKTSYKCSLHKNHNSIIFFSIMTTLPNTQALNVLDMNAASVLNFLQTFSLLNNDQIFTENEFIGALNNRNPDLLISLFSTLYGSLMAKKKKFQTLEGVEKSLFPALRARSAKAVGDFPDLKGSPSIESWTARQKSCVLANLCDWVAEEFDDVAKVADVCVLP